MINNDNEFQKAFNKYLKSKGIKGNEEFFCGRMNCEDCLFKNLTDCSRKPFWEIKRCEERLSMMKKEIELIKSWEKENKTLTKEELEEEKIYAEIQRLITKNGELTKEIARLYRKLDQMEKGEKKNG